MAFPHATVVISSSGQRHSAPRSRRRPRIRPRARRGIASPGLLRHARHTWLHPLPSGGATMTVPGSSGAPHDPRPAEPAGEASGAWAIGSAWWRVTLSSIGDAVITTDATGRVTFLNPVASTLTGWSAGDAVDKPVTDVFRIVREGDRRPA
ncbi:MAG: PAS domain-containing protein, partial [Gemmatimonadetes bacterium]|nr:PAS domain-containing protein [Gemmatimonadota bacterium]